MQDLKAELAKSIDQAEWNWLIPHAKRDAIFVVSRSLNLVDVGVAVACDDVLSVQHWISTEQFHKPSADQLALWNLDSSRRFNALIVQPFVLVQELGDAE